MKRHFIREILESATADTISFAGGVPDAALFPVEAFRAAAETAMQDPDSLQYSRSQGYAPLCEKIAKRYCDTGFPTRPEEILITTGSQQAINLIALGMLPHGVTVELPAYLGALNVFRMAEIAVDGVPIESDGIALEPFRESVARTKAAYLITDFQNPTGVRYTPAKRREVARILKEEGALLIEDAAYGELFFDEPLEAVSASMPDASFHLGSFSKILAPGLRVGWVRADAEKIQRILVVKEALDLHTSTLGQRMIDAYLEHEDVEAHIGKLRRRYQSKKHLLVSALRDTLPEFEFNEPQGGMFIYGRLPGTDTKALVDLCRRKKVVFVPGAEFYPEAGINDEIRFNFTNTDPDAMRAGIAVVAECYRALAKTESPYGVSTAETERLEIEIKN